LVGQHGVRGALDRGEEESGAARFDDAIRDFGDLEVRVDERADLGEFPRAPERRDELAQ
jgi:hypothetical protein